MAGRTLSRVGRAARWAPLLAVLLTGCGEQGYPTDLAYPLRSDLLVLKKPGNPAGFFYPEPPGQLDQDIARFGKDDDVKDGQTLNPADLSDFDRKALTRALRNRFGSPARPRVSVPDGYTSEEHPLDQVRGVIRDLLLDEQTLSEGSKLYRRHCLHCHGLDGGGRGPTGPWVSPHPRDYRQGHFKFISTTVAGRPTRDDLWRVVHHGIDGSTMPAFNTLEDEEIDRLVSYVIHLSIRGEVEYRTIPVLVKEGRLESDYFLPEGEGPADEAKRQEMVRNIQIADHVMNATAAILDEWGKAARSGIAPVLPEAERVPADEGELGKSIERGYKLFISSGAPGGCSQCHTDFGRSAVFKYDEWGTRVKPNSLPAGVYHGGRRPIDIYWRVRAGISPVEMAAAPWPGTREEQLKTDRQVWDLVNFVQNMPYPAMLEKLAPEVHDKVYPTRKRGQ
jgi:mono/diheme cytochrome c family protein